MKTLLQQYNEKLDRYVQEVEYWKGKGQKPENIVTVELARRAKERAWKVYKEATD